MDLSQIINELNSKLLSNEYVDLLWKRINPDIDSLDINIQANVLRQLENDYRNHLPVDFEELLETILKIINKCLADNESIDWDTIDQPYFITLLFWSLQERNEVDILIPIHAGRIYFLINTFPNNEKTNYDTIFYECLSLIKYINSLDYNDSSFCFLLQSFNLYLIKNHIHNNFLIDTIDSLFSVACKNVNTIFLDFSMDLAYLNKNHLAFLCLKSIFIQDDFDKTFTVSYLMNKHNQLCFNLTKNKFIVGNIEELLCNMKEHLKNETLISLKYLNALGEYNDYDRVVKILNNLEYKDYIEFCDYLLRVLRQTEITSSGESKLEHSKQCFRKMGLSVMKYPHPKVDSEKRSTYLGFLIDIYFSLLVDDDKESVCYFIDQILSISESDQNIKKVISTILNRDINLDINLLSILEVLRLPVDLLWCKKEYNVLYINIICKLSFMKTQILFTGSVLSLIEKLCLEASPLDLKMCSENLLAVMVKNYNQPLVVEKILNVFVHFALMPITASSVYCKLLSTSILQNVVTKTCYEKAIKIADILISNSYDYENVFKKFHTNNYIKPTILPVVVKELSTHKESWKLLNALCDVININNTKDFLIVVCYVDSMLNENSYDNANVMFSVLYKIIKQKPPLSADHVGTLKSLQEKVIGQIAERQIPVQCITNVFGFLKLADNYVKNTSWDIDLFNDFQERVLKDLNNIINNQSVASHIFQRHALYFANICLICDISVNSDFAKCLEHILVKFNELFLDFTFDNLTTWTSCLAVYTAICIKEKRIISERTNKIFSLAFKAEDTNVNIHAVHYFYDLCNVHLDNFDGLVKNIFQLLGERDSYFAVHSVKIIERLISNDYIRLSEGQLLKFVSLLAHENYHVRETIKYTLRKNFIAKTQHTIADYFVGGIVHYNAFKGHAKYCLAEKDALNITLSKDKRCTIYRYLFNLLPKRNQFNILTEISLDIFEPLLKSTIKIPWDIFKDSLYIFYIFVCQHYHCDRNDNKEYYEKCIKDLCTLSSVKSAPNVKEVKFPEFHNEIELILKKMLYLPYYILKVNEGLYEVVIETLLLITQCCLIDIKHITYHRNHTWIKLFKGFCALYRKNVDKLTFMSEFEGRLTYENFQENAQILSTPTSRPLPTSPSFFIV